VGAEDDELIPRSPFLRLLGHPLLFSLVLALVLGLAGSVGLLGGRFGPQLVPRGTTGFAYGATLGLAVGALYALLRRRRLGPAWIAAAVAIVTLALTFAFRR
jgi:peptidoglycan/LPS O-acetylase OafA/YrhL